MEGSTLGNKLFVGIIVGAAVGAGISLLNRETREKTVRQVTNVKTDMQYFLNSKDEVKENVGDKVSTVKALISNVIENKEYYLEKINELKSLTPAVTSMLANTKQTFSDEPFVDEFEKEAKQNDESVIHL